MRSTITALSALLLLASGCAAEYDLGANPEGDGLGDDGTEDGTVNGVQGPSGGIEGWVYAPDGVTPVAGAEIWVDTPGGPVLVTTDGDGHFVIEDVPVGDGTITIEKGRFTDTTEVTVEEDEITEVIITLRQGDVKIAVVTGIYDHIDSMLTSLNLTYDTVDGINTNDYVDFLRSPNRLGAYDMVFFNCGMGFDWLNHQSDVAGNLRAYVQGGGALYASDWAYYIVEAGWPAKNDFHGDDSVVGDAFKGLESDVLGNVYDATMIDILGSNAASIRYDLDAWAGLVATNADEVLVEGNYSFARGAGTGTRSAALATRFADGDGSVTYTSFHNESQATLDMALMLQEIVLSL